MSIKDEKLLRTAQGAINAMEDEYVQQISDGSHTFKELYETRNALTLVVLKLLRKQGFTPWYSLQQFDGNMPAGYFLCGFEMGGKMISFHVQVGYLPLFIPICKELHTAPEWDGSTSQDHNDAMIDFSQKDEEDETSKFLEALKEVLDSEEDTPAEDFQIDPEGNLIDTVSDGVEEQIDSLETDAPGILPQQGDFDEYACTPEQLLAARQDIPTALDLDGSANLITQD